MSLVPNAEHRAYCRGYDDGKRDAALEARPGCVDPRLTQYDYLAAPKASEAWSDLAIAHATIDTLRARLASCEAALEERDAAYYARTTPPADPAPPVVEDRLVDTLYSENFRLRGSVIEYKQRAEAMAGLLAECFALAGGDVECVSTIEGRAKQAIRVVADLRQCYDALLTGQATPEGAS